jgi:lactoylglutathione lyase
LKINYWLEGIAMLSKVDYVMVNVSDMSSSVEFYRDKLGLKLKFQSDGWTEFQTETTTLALHGGGKTQEHTKDTDPKTTYAGTCSIGFNVENVSQVYEELKAKGVNFVMPPMEREGEGIKLTVCIDPDGLPISFAEMIKK